MSFVRWRLAASSAAALLLFATAASSAAAQGTVTGRVTAEGTGQPLAGARVLVTGTTQGAVAGEDGKYTIRNVAAGTSVLQVLDVGFTSVKKSATITSGGTTIVDFQLAVATIQLQDVVITATGQQRRVELGNAIATLGDVGKKVEQGKISGLSDLLLAKAPGVVVLPGTTLGGAPTVRIRGLSSISLSNAPIYYVDGVRYSAGTTGSGTDTPFSLLNTLNPEEIEDIEIVKGPSAATLYGTNAANGVVLISTKKGRAGTTHWNWFAENRTVVDASPYQPMYANWGHAPGSTAPVRCQLSTMTTPQFAGICVSDSITSYNLLRDPERTFVKYGRGGAYGVNVTGGTEAVRFFVSGSVDNEYGPVQMSDQDVSRFEDSLHIGVRPEWFHPLAADRLGFRANVSATLSPKFDLSTTMGFTKTTNRIPPESDLIIALWYVAMQNYGFKGPGLDKIVNQVDGTPLNDAFQWNPGDIMQYVNQQDLQRFTGSTNASWRPFSWMQNDGTVGIDLTNIDFWHICRLNECPPQSATARVGNATDNRSNQRNFSVKFASTSSFSWRDWANFKTSVGGDYTNVESDNLNTSGQTLAPGGVAVSQASTRNVGSQSQPSAVKTLGVYVQEQAALNDRLFVTAAIRTDQNSAFGFNFQKVYYPKVSASWIASDERFFPKLSWMDLMRLRLSYGASGVQPGATQGLTTFSAASVSIPARGTTVGTDVAGLQANNPGNANLKPETSAELETGFETRLLKNRVTVDYTYYSKKTKDALISVPLAPSVAASVTSLLQNVGSTQNYGHEIQVNAQLFESRNVSWDVTVNGSHNTSNVVDLGIDPTTGIPRIIGAGGTTRQISGYPIFSQWYRPYTYKDANGDGVLQRSEVQVDSGFFFKGIGVARDIVSVINGIDLLGRKLRINMSFDYRGGGNTQDGANNFQCNTAPNACAETQVKQEDLNFQARQIAKSSGTTIGGTSYKTTVGYFMSNQFWKFRELSAVYTLPARLNRSIRAQTGSTIVFSVRNIHTWSGFTGIDPEANYGVGGSENQNEFQTAGAPTYYSLRLNLKY